MVNQVMDLIGFLFIIKVKANNYLQSFNNFINNLDITSLHFTLLIVIIISLMKVKFKKIFIIMVNQYFVFSF